MIISKHTARRAVRRQLARYAGTVIFDGWRWQAVERLDLQRTDHYRMERTKERAGYESV